MYAPGLVRTVTPVSRPEPVRARDELLVVLGRGIQFDGTAWRPTPDLEVYRKGADRPVHFARPVPVDPSDPLCLVGGGQLNLAAAATILRRRPMLTVLGFAPPSRYLREEDGPSESQVMSDALLTEVPAARVVRWSGATRGDSNTETEVRNAFGLAKRRSLRRIRFLTVSPHLARVLLTAHLVSRELANRDSRPPPDWFGVSSEGVVAESGEEGRARVSQLQRSPAYRRTIAYESRGIALLLRRLDG